MAKKLMALLLAVLMAVSLLPMPALADGGLTAGSTNGNFKLTDNTTLAAPLNVDGDMTIDLNGHDLTFSTGEASDAIFVKSGTLTLKGRGTVDMKSVATGIALSTNTALAVSDDVSLTGQNSAIKVVAGATNVTITVNTTGTISAQYGILLSGTDGAKSLTITAGTIHGDTAACGYAVNNPDNPTIETLTANEITASAVYDENKTSVDMNQKLGAGTFVFDDGQAPELNVTAARTEEKKATVSISSTKAGTYYYRLDGEGKPTVDDLTAAEAKQLTKGSNTLELDVADGAEHTIYLAAKDNYGHTSKEVVTVPVPAMLAAPENPRWDGDNGKTAAWNIVEGTSYTVQLFKDNTLVHEYTGVPAAVDCSEKIQANGDGSYTFKVCALGNNTVGTWAKSAEISVDMTAPEITDVSVVRTAQDSATITLNSNEAGTLYYALGTEPTDIFASANTAELKQGENTISLTGLTSSAAVTVYYAAEDTAENRNSVSTVNIPLYLAAPTGLTWEGTTAKWAAVESASSYKVQLYKDGVEDSNKSGDLKNVTDASCDFSGISESGTYYFKVQAVTGDVTSAWSTVTEGHTVDKTAPTLSNAAASRSDAASGTVTFQSNEAGKVYYIVGGETPTTEAVLASEKTQAIAAGDNSVAISGITNAKAVNVYLVAVDEKENASNVVTVTVPVFLAKPTTISWYNATTTAQWNPIEGADGYNIQLLKDGAVFGDLIAVDGGLTTTADLDSHMTEDGVYTFKVQATATGGAQSEWSDASATTYKRDTQKPTVKAEPSKRIDEKTAEIYFTASEDGTYYYTVGAANAAAPAANQIADDKNPHGGCTNAKTTIRLKDISDKDARRVFVVVCDESGNLSDVYTITIPAYTATPTATPTPAPTATPAPTTAPTTYTVTLQGGTGYTIKANSGSSSPVNAGGSFSFTVTPSSGYVKGNGFAVKANGTTLQANNYGVYTINNINANQTVSVSGIVKSSTSGGTLPAAPAITTTTLAAATMGKEYRQQITATGGTPITWSYSGTLPDGMTLAQNTGILSGTPTQEGSFRFAVKATNSTGFSTKQLTLVVSGSEYTVTKGANTEWTQGGDKGFDLSGSGKGSFTVKVDGATVPTGKYTASADGATVTLKPEYLDTLAAGSHTVTLVYADGSAKAKFTIKKQDKTVAPTVSSQPANAEAGEGSSAVFSVTASGTTPLLCQWQVDKNDGKGWEDITGAVNASYTVDAVTAEQNGWKYRCVITNAAGSVESNAATLTVKEAIGDVKKNDDTQKNDTGASKLGRILLIVGISVAVVALGVGLYLYFRRRNASRYY